MSSSQGQEKKFNLLNPETYNPEQQVAAMLICGGIIAIILAYQAYQVISN